MLNISPIQFFVVAILAGVVLVGFYFYLRDIVASGIDLAQQKKEQRERREREIRNRKK